MLRDGSAIIANVSNGALLRIYPNGARKVVLGGLLYPNGLDVGPDGFVYVSENAAGRVRRIDPETGDFSIVALGLFGPNGVAFGDDPQLMYIGSFEGSGVYKVVLKQPGELGVASVLARPHGSKLPEPKLACPDQKVGKPCEDTMSHASGTCQRLANVVDCVPSDGAPDACAGKPDGTSCGDGGTCQDGFCQLPDPCVGKQAGDACTAENLAGTCEELIEGTLVCQPEEPSGDGPGGIDGLGVDACGNVYASEFTYGIVWRISPAGEIERLVDLPSHWVPNIKWGRGLGGFGRDQMFVADRDESRLFAVAVGVPGAREFYEGAKP
jgi:sugar lactone lactonase YvrE